ncbi:MAG: phage tail tape measure protein [Devosia sp.]
MADKTLNASLIMTLIDRVSAPSRAMLAAQKRLQAGIDANTAHMNQLRGRMVDAGAVGYGLYRALSAPLAAAIEFEGSMADVRKVVDFDTPEAFAQMGRDIIDMSLSIPIAANGIAEIVAAAGQAGIAGAELTAFAEGAAKVGVAFDIGAGEAGDAMAKLRTSLGYTNEEVFLLADAMNHLSNTQASGADEILAFVNEAGPMAKGFGLSAEQAAAFGSAMIASGANVEKSVTSFQNMGAALVAGVAATGAQTKAFKRLGLDAKKVATAMQVDAEGTIIDVLERINELPADVKQATIFQLFGKNADALLPLINNMGTLGQSLDMVSSQTLYAGSAQREFEVRSKTTANAVQLFKNNANALGITIGAALLPGLNDLLGAISPIIRRIAEFSESNPKLVSTLVALTAGLVGLRVAAIAAQWSLAWMKGGVLSAALGATKGASAIMGMLNPLKLVTNAFKLLKLAVVSTGVGALVVGLAMAGTWIYNNWNGLGEMFSAFGAAFETALGPMYPLLEPIINGVKSLAGFFGNVTGELDGAKWTEWGTSAGTAVGEFVVGAITKVQEIYDFLAGIPGKLVALPGEIAKLFTSIDWVGIGVGMMNALWEGIKSIVPQIGNYLATEFGKLNPFAGWGGGPTGTSTVPSPEFNGGPLPVPANLPAFAMGGRVARGMTALVGEAGPEIVTFGSSGYVHPNGSIPRLAAPALPSFGGGAQAKGNTIGSQSFNFEINLSNPVNADPRMLSRMLAEEINDNMKASFSNGFF